MKTEPDKSADEFYKGFTPWRVDYPKLLAFVRDCANDSDDRISPGLKKQARDALDVEKLPVPMSERVQRIRCQHPPKHVTADIMEGDYGSGVRWCRLCGAYQRYFYLEECIQESDGVWVEPAIETLKTNP